jgi:predicted metal-dependent HD superfamily phosphohydrolase
VLRSWTDLLGRVVPAADPAAVEAAGDDLLRRYAEPDRFYHDGRHLAEVLAAVDAIADQADQPDAVRVAAWFHDAVYRPQAGPGANEEASAELAETVLAGLGADPRLVRQVADLVRMTANHDAPDADHDAMVLSDADLAILASAADRYQEYAADVRCEYAHVPDPAFRSGRAAILVGFAARPRIYRTEPAYAAWEQLARANLAAELADLSRPGDGRPGDGRPAPGAGS